IVQLRLLTNVCKQVTKREPWSRRFCRISSPGQGWRYAGGLKFKGEGERC
ncbi:MAG: hypothetical protein FD135_5078, partial [Comamonadaceae bacterium]